MTQLTILHIFSGDLWAGAEVMIFNLLNKLKDDPRLNIIALSFNEGALTEKLRIAGIDTPVLSEHRHSFVQIYLKALRFNRKYKIDVIHSHRFKENVLAILLSKFPDAQQLFVTLHDYRNRSLK